MKNFKGSIIFAICGLIIAGIWSLFREGSINAVFMAVFLTLILSVLEVSLSFDNAVVNAAVLENMSEVWQKRFLTWGILIAVFGMRVIFPVIIVSVVASLGPISVLKIAFTDPDTYAMHLTESHHVISAFGGMFLLMVFLKFILDEEKDVHWVHLVEEQLVKLGKLESFEIVIALGVLLFAQSLVPEHEKLSVILSGLAGLMIYVIIDGIAGFLEESEEKMLADGVKQGGIAMFLYLEVLDASFSFDGVIGAFAITKDIVLIAIGLGIGAMFVRSLTIYLVNKGTLQEYIFLEHGAHYAIGILALIMLLGITYHIPEVVTGLSGVFLISLALWSSVSYNKKEALKEAEAN